MVFVNSREISEGIEGAVTGNRVNCVSHMLYADELGLTTNDPGEMQTMLNKLRAYAEKKGLTVNTAKSEVVHFNSKSVSPLQNPFTYNGVRGASREGQVQIFGHAA